MYNVALNKTLFQSGQDFIKSFGGPLELTNLPIGLTEQLLSLTAHAQSCWNNYQEGCVNNFPHERIFGLAVRAVTAVTLGAEIIIPYYWVLRMEYYQDQKAQMTAAHAAFAASGNELCKLIYNIGVELNKNAAPQTEQAAAENMKRLQYALHLTDIGLDICKPKGYGKDSWNPATTWWLSLRARTLRNLAAMQIHSARFLEEQERELIAAQS